MNDSYHNESSWTIAANHDGTSALIQELSERFHSPLFHERPRERLPLWCRGSNWRGRLGDGTTIPHSTPQRVRGLDRVRSVFLGSSHSCVIRDDGSLWCSGSHDYGALGSALPSRGVTRIERHPLPIQVPLPRPAVRVALGVSLTRVALDDGTARCWALNWLGQLGDGNAFLPALSDVAVIATANFGSCVTGAGALWGLGAPTCTATSPTAARCRAVRRRTRGSSDDLSAYVPRLRNRDPSSSS
jgi:hypothetical protein